MKENRKDKLNRGITLIVLVITIIILLILAGISIKLALGENGLINNSKYAQQEYNKSQKEEQETMDLYSSMIIAANDNAQVTMSVTDLKK